jgi:carbon monoxide dehydrogenase subunit G
MDHEVFVPFPAETVRQALADSARVARSVPGLQQDAGAAEAGAGEETGAEAVTGRLRLRIGGSTITYRGTLRLSETAEGFAAEAEAAEARGAGVVKLAIGIAVEAVEGGTLLTFSGTVRADGGRLAEFEPETTEAAGHRLLDRFVGELTTDLPEQQEDETVIPAENEAGASPEAGTEAGTEDEAEAEAEDELLPDGLTVPESAAELDPLDDDDLGPLDALDLDPLNGTDRGSDGTDAAIPEPPAEAAHARRTMIGRSAEEVDHAPPRGRYAPVPPPESVSATATLRWAAPAAAVLIAGAVVVGRVLRRRGRG